MGNIMTEFSVLPRIRPPGSPIHHDGVLRLIYAVCVPPFSAERRFSVTLAKSEPEL